ncbi:diguanylate cyclase domain-containing protein [Pengzhenrongella sp.]|uniref:diguanylate cyclase domain-containing protein n=1 Tax=Pengzhenrongella sp. TaxID=2888820 RepID=UPI002F9479CB
MTFGRWEGEATHVVVGSGVGEVDVVKHAVVADGEPGPTWSLRREWSRAFTIMLVLLLIAAVATVIGVRAVVDNVEGTARQLHLESVTIAALRTDLVAHEETGHSIMSAQQVDRPAFVGQQQAIVREFGVAERVFAGSPAMRATVVEAERSWQAGLTTYGLWGDRAVSMQGDHGADNRTFGASSDDSRAILDSIEGPSLAAMDRGLASGADFERILILVVAGLFALALAVTAYFRRRMTTDLVRPVAGLHDGVKRVQAGDYDHPIEVARRDELGELAEAFNAMAHDLFDTHVALTLRATHDSLTGLANRASLTDRLATAFSPGSERRARHESLLFIDVDDFKDVNDSVGHEGGDDLLIEMAARLSNCVRAGDLVARLGGDEFAILVMDDDRGSAALEVAERILESLVVPFVVGETELLVAVSIGVAQRGPATADAPELLRQADFAMYMAKGGGKGRYQFFDAQMHAQMAERATPQTEAAVAV